MIFSLVIAVVNYFSQRAVRIAPSKVPEVTGHPIVNTDMLVRCMDRMMLDMDQMLNNTSAPELPAPELSRGMMESIQMLMEARINEDGNYALKALPQMMDALQRQGIEVLLFDQDTKQNFDLLPAPDGGETIRPALVKDGHVLCRGQATVKG
ncbi:hypothetical protein LJC33_05390 [Eubacteriales bacterium OttesenSCG-928-N13]|nr:hypothetical protein [Eubacteriales bacterium OttesenSCG-928-N13]